MEKEVKESWFGFRLYSVILQGSSEVSLGEGTER